MDSKRFDLDENPRNKLIGRARAAILILGFSLLLPGCLVPPVAEVCPPGQESACQCPNGEATGRRQCNEEGTGFKTSCICDSEPTEQTKDATDSTHDAITEETFDSADVPPDIPELPDSESEILDSVDTKEFSDSGHDTHNDGEVDTSVDVPCNEDPWQCPPGQTCWLSGDTNDEGLWAGTFSCLNSRPNGLAGCTCDLKLGIPSCADGLYCLVLIGADAPPPHCTQFCDNTNPEHPCPVGFYCGPVDVLELTLHLCRSETGQVETKDCSVQP